MAAPTHDIWAAKIVEKGEEIYKRQVPPDVEAANKGRLIGIDVNTEQFEIGDDVMGVSRRLLERHPDAQIAMLRVGGGPVYRIGMVPGGIER